MVKTCRVDDKNCKLQIWDTAGAERFRELSANYFAGVDGMIVCYDMNNRSTWSKVPDYMEKIRASCPAKCVKILVGCKQDLNTLENQRVRLEEGKSMAGQHGVKFSETSAKSNLNIEHVFTTLTQEMLNK